MLKRFPRRVVIASSLLLMSLCASLGIGGGAQAVDNGTLGIRPATESAYFHLSVAPGSSLAETALVTNRTTEPLSLLTYVVDGTTTPQGEFALESQDAQPRSVGLWTTLNATSITVPPETEIAVPFTITVPVGTMPGDYVGGVIIQTSVVTGETSSAADGTAVRIDVVNRQGVRIYLNVAGEAVLGLRSGALSWAQEGSVVDVTLPVTNTGNTTLHPNGSVAFESLLGANTTIDVTTPQSILPGATVNLTATLTPAALIQVGRLSATVTSEAPDLTQTANFISIPWWILLAVLAILAIAAFLVRRHLRFAKRARLAFARLEAHDLANSTRT